jgi:hypothetical protein
MVGCARPAFRMATIVVVALLVFGRPLSRFLGTAEFMVAAAAVTGAVAAGHARGASIRAELADRPAVSRLECVPASLRPRVTSTP